MQISDDVEHDLQKLRGFVFEGDNFSVQFFMPIAVRYCESGRHLTLEAQFQAEKPVRHRGIRGFLDALLIKSHLDVYIDQPLEWDNTDVVLTEEAKDRIIVRLTDALQKFGGKFEVVIRSATV